ncbi:MAG: glycosyltransferase family 39 protein, partial [Deltaproteobacteria bacterium]|nr:glycosyltransferase family 39 protein [Deltaproteobacteria bacterium]
MSKYLDLLDNLSITHRLALIITAAFFVRLYVVFNAVMIPPDSVTYLRLASEFASGNYGEAFNVQRPPLYPFLISVSSYIFGDLEFSARIVSLVFGTLTIATAFLIGKTVYDERTGLITAFLVAIHPYLIRYSGDALTEGLYHFTFSIAVLASMKGAIERSPRWMIAAGFFVLLTYMTKPSGLGILFVTSLWILLYKPFSIKEDWGERLKLLLSGWLIFIILALPYLVFLFTQTGE